MSNLLQEFLATATCKAATELEVALLRLPEDKRNWQMSEGSRSAANQVAECAVMNSGTIAMLQNKVFPDQETSAGYQEAIPALAADPESLIAALRENTARVADVIRAAPTEELSLTLESPWGPMTLSDILAYPYWNMTYHTGQINLIHAVLSSSTLYVSEDDLADRSALTAEEEAREGGSATS